MFHVVFFLELQTFREDPQINKTWATVWPCFVFKNQKKALKLRALSLKPCSCESQNQHQSHPTLKSGTFDDFGTAKYAEFQSNPSDSWTRGVDCKPSTGNTLDLARGTVEWEGISYHILSYSIMSYCIILCCIYYIVLLDMMICICICTSICT